jgi:hypothetical protein
MATAAAMGRRRPHEGPGRGRRGTHARPRRTTHPVEPDHEAVHLMPDAPAAGTPGRADPSRPGGKPSGTVAGAGCAVAGETGKARHT